MRRYLPFVCLMLFSTAAVAQDSNPQPAADPIEAAPAALEQPAQPVVAQAPAIETLVFMLDGSPGDYKKHLEAAIEDTVDDMNFITRPIASGKLEKSNVVFKRVTLILDGDFVDIQHDNRKSIRSKSNGKDAVKWKRDDGEEFKVTQLRTGDHVVQTYTSEDGKKVIDYQLSADHKKLTMKVEVISSKLPKSLKYTLKYKVN